MLVYGVSAQAVRGNRSSKRAKFWRFMVRGATWGELSMVGKCNFNIKLWEFLFVPGKIGRLMESQTIKKAGKPLPLSETCG